MLFSHSKQLFKKMTQNSSLQNWLIESPKYTIFRINKLMQLNVVNLQNYLEEQRKELNSDSIPKYYFLKPDCLVIEQWPAPLTLEKTNNEVIVDPLCAAAVLRGAHVYAPGVLGLPSNCVINERIDIYGSMDGQCKRGHKVKYEGNKQYVGTGYLKMLRSNLFEKGVQPNGIAVQTLLPASRLPVINETIFPKGQVLLQNLPSIIAGWVVNAQPYEYILDMCAAPGNKTTHLGEMSDNKAVIIAIDKTIQKCAKIQQTCDTQGVTCVKAYAYDSTKCHSDDTENNIMKPPFCSNTFDKILLDAPCSGLGQRPQLNNNISLKMLHSYKFVQRKLFDVAVKILKINGKLIYSTCTVTVDENEGMVSWVLEKFPCLKLIPAEPLYGGPGLPNVGLSDKERVMVQRFGPEDDDLRPVEDIYRNTIGFFIAAFVKTEDYNT
ncbi:tRNA (cytosine(72)-C(5))-methyltransferase NSUN6 [Nymphalis io]|uniref:tRNA (cytosine(72)-C(5))-methyltransferase NSUN6 n=1 Tax=Inachis io TaxID=171585 RepID=UPI00216A1A85|nr:tRNA (cytosine(72)-C(5))-methyltransferase NSUN6 [Nymphalis io]